MQRAIILAAGAGKRLGELTKVLPKCLLPVVKDRTVLDLSLEVLKKFNLKEVILVVGYKSETIKAHISKKWNSQFDFEFIFNEKFNEYNNIYSAYLAKDFWNDETILLNSDIVFHLCILGNLKSEIESRHCEEQSDEAISLRETLADCFVRAKALPRNDTKLRSFLVVDNKKKLVAEDMKVKLDKNGKIIKLNKNLDIQSSFGEYIGITYLRENERLKFLESLEKNVKEKNFDLYYEDALDQILNSISIYPLSTNGLPWTEIDTKEDYEYAKVVAKEVTELEEVVKI